jgi:riboflavin kinase / FMN adenylyltransferase
MSMRIFNGVENLEELNTPVLTIGTFDGIHLGHQKIIKNLIREARSTNSDSVLLTFFPHPRMVLFPENNNLQLIQTQEEKYNKLAELGLKNTIVQPFSKEFSKLTALEFIEEIIVNKIRAKKIIIGYDHQFGNSREGNIDFLREYSDKFGYEVIEIPAKEIDEINVSSTKIRTALNEGDIQIANLYLNSPFEINGIVVHGNKIGRSINFPTANIEIDDKSKIIPKNGVYAVKVFLNEKKYFGMLNIGTRPSISKQLSKTIEVNIFDFDEMIYDLQIKITFHKHIREEKYFSNLEELKSQLQLDASFIRAFFELPLV